MRAPVLAAGGIVLRQMRPPLIAVVRLRKGNEWVLPKGKLDDGETPRDAAVREVLEETGHDVSVHEFLGTLAYEAGGRPKIVHYWRMEGSGKPTRELMHDVTAVDWLPLNAALQRLSRDHERAFLANVGPMALENARRSKERKPAAIEKPAPEKLASEKSVQEKPAQEKPAQQKLVAEKPRRRRAVAPRPAVIAPALVASAPDVAVPVTAPSEHVVSDDVAAAVDRYIDKPVVVERDAIERRTSKHHADEPHAVQADAARPADEEVDDSASLAVQDQPSEADCDDAGAFDEAHAEAAPADEDDMVRAEPELASVEAHQSSRISVMQRVRGWLRRAG